MKKIVFLSVLSFSFFLTSFGAHLKGGFFTYHYLGPGILDPANNRYRIILTVYMDCGATPAQITDPINFTFFDGVSGQLLENVSVPIALQYNLAKTRDEECITGDQSGCYYKIVVYDLGDKELAPRTNGYTISYQRCCRIAGVQNITSSAQIGNTYSITIPGSGAQTNSSAQFLVNDTAVLCRDSYFTIPFIASDINGDSLTYEFCNAWEGGSAMGNPAPPTAAAPPYATVPYQLPFNGAQPLGSLVTIHAQTGIISGIAPGTAGEYVITVCVNEFKNGVLIARNKKELHVRIGACNPITPSLDPQYITCDGFTLTFSNHNPSPEIQTYFWDFGDGITSASESPIHTFVDTGTYRIKIVVNRGLACSDSTTALAKVYPGFFPGFIFNGICVNNSTRFTDTTRTNYGIVDSWRWDFGEASVSNDTSRLQNPIHTYSSVGKKNVRFIVTNSKGCIDTVFKDITIIDKPPLSLAFADTLICIGDNVQLQANGTGIFSWTPSINISNANTATPVVTPATTTTYFVELNDNGCKNLDSVRVRVVDRVTVSAGSDTAFCFGDGVRLNATSDGLQYSWSPATDLNNPNILNPISNPPVTTTYQITARIGGCQANDDVIVFVVPYPFVNAGNDTIICYNTLAQLNGNYQGTSFNWSPVLSINNPNILNPVASPKFTTPYILTAFDNKGCPKPGRDTVIVTVLPKVKAYAGEDTAVVVGQLLQFLASGGVMYLWFPSLGLNDINIPDPVGIYDGSSDTIRYRVLVADQAGCVDSAFVSVTVFKVSPQIFVPSAFTPNADGKNDLFRPIAVGIKKFEYFRVYNRWGQLVFTTRINGHGWDGNVGGRPQSTHVFVWIVKGIDYLDRPFFQKGSVTLIR